MAERLDDAAVRDRLSRVDELLERIERTPGPVTEAALDAVRSLAEVYGEGLARVLDHAGADLAAGLGEDELLAHLLVLHGLHPDPPQRRARRALDGLRPHLHPTGVDAELVGITAGTARIRLSGSCRGCSSSAATVEQAVVESVRSVAPELDDVEVTWDSGEPEPSLVPVEALMSRMSVRRGRS